MFGAVARRAAFGVCLATGCRFHAARHSDADRNALLRTHEQILAAHRAGDVEAWLALEIDEQVVAGRGEITFPTKAERRESLQRYLSAAHFTSYRDVRAPIVRVSDDGSLGWVIAQVEVTGTLARDGELPEPIDDVWAWIELYERKGDRWQLIGNVSSARPSHANR